MLDLNSLEGKVLIAPPHISDLYFEHAIIYICSHNENGTIGVMLNQCICSITIPQLLKHYAVFLELNTPSINKKSPKTQKRYPMLFGGPINTETIMAISSREQHNSVKNSYCGLNIRTDMDRFLKDIMHGEVPSKLVLIKGISTWEAGQLEEEIAENKWFLFEPSVDLIFPSKTKRHNNWKGLMESIGLTSNNHYVHYVGNV